jgi:hypothetical protein
VAILTIRAAAWFTSSRGFLLAGFRLTAGAGFFAMVLCSNHPSVCPNAKVYEKPNCATIKSHESVYLAAPPDV